MLSCAPYAQVDRTKQDPEISCKTFQGDRFRQGPSFPCFAPSSYVGKERQEKTSAGENGSGGQNRYRANQSQSALRLINDSPASLPGPPHAMRSALDDANPNRGPAADYKDHADWRAWCRNIPGPAEQRGRAISHARSNQTRFLVSMRREGKRTNAQ